MSDIRVTYSGLISFLVSILGVIVGTIFVVIVTRRLSPEDLGLWTLIGSLVSYVVIIEPVITYWTTRQIARGEKVGRMAIVTTGSLSALATMIFFVMAIFVSYYLKADLSVLALASALVPLAFFQNILEGISLSHKPQSISYGIMVFEVSKLPLGVVFVLLLQLGIVGALLATIVATTLRVVLLAFFVRKEFVGMLRREILTFWFRMAWLPLYISSTGLVYKFDVLIFSIMTNSFVGLAFWGASQTAANIVSMSGNISQAIYPKLIATGKKEFVEENLKRTMYFAIPILGASLLFAKAALHTLNPLYIEATFVVYLLAFRSFIGIFLSIYFNILSAYDTVDVDKQSSFKQYIKSKLFLVPTLNHILSISYVGILILFLLFSSNTNISQVDKVVIWALILFAVTLPFVVYGAFLVKKDHKIDFPYKSTLKYAAITIIASVIIFIISEKTLTYPQSIWNFLPEIIPLVVLGGVIYFGVTYLIDESTRKLFRSIMDEIKKK